jgi:quinol monooxygenase YgiN
VVYSTASGGIVRAVWHNAQELVVHGKRIIPWNFSLMIHVIATVQLHPGKRAQFLTELLAVVPKVRAEQGCLEYTPTSDLETSLPTQGSPREDTVIIVERWVSMECLEAHLIAPHMLEYRPKVRDCIARVGLQILKPIAAE